MSQLAKVMGMKANKGSMDNGQAYDSTKVYIETKLDESKGNAKGFVSAEYNLGLSVEYQRFNHLTFPFMANVTFEQVSSGKLQKTVIADLQPITPAKGA